MEAAATNNEWIDSYLEALLSGGLSNEYKKLTPQDVAADDETDLCSQYFLNQILNCNETALKHAWRKSQANRGDRKEARLQYLSWRVWGMHRKQGTQPPITLENDIPEELCEGLSPTMADGPSPSFFQRTQSGNSKGWETSANALVHQNLPHLKTGFKRSMSGTGSASGGLSPTTPGATVNPFAGRVDKLYLVLVSLHGLVRAKNMELGKDADTGGQVKYVVELAKNLAQHPMVHRVDLMTRLIQSPDVADDYGKEEECIVKTDGDFGGAYIVRLKAGDSKTYLAKEDLWPHVREFADNGLQHVRMMKRKMIKEPTELYAVHGHYADAGEVASLMSHTLGVELVLTGHSLGRNKLDHLLKLGQQTRVEIEETYKLSRRIEGEERALDAAVMVVTSTQQEIDQQWCLYDGYDTDKAKAMSNKAIGRHMPRMKVIPPGLDFSSLKVSLPADPNQLFIDYDNTMMDRAKTLHSNVSASQGNLQSLVSGNIQEDPAAPQDLAFDDLEEIPDFKENEIAPIRGLSFGGRGNKSSSRLDRMGSSDHGSLDGRVVEEAVPEIWTKCWKFLRNPHKPVVLAMSRPDAKKNITTLVKAFGENPTLREIANLVLVMGNRDNIDNLAKGSQTVLQNVLKLIDTYDLYGSVAYPKGHSQQDISDIYLLAHKTRGVFTNIALQEPFGLTLIEAAVHGVPIIATRHGGPVDIIRTLQNGQLVEPTDSAAVSTAILNVIKDPTKWDAYSQKGVDNILAYSWPSHCIKYLEAIDAEKSRARLLANSKHSQLQLRDQPDESSANMTKDEAIEALKFGHSKLSALAAEGRQHSLPELGVQMLEMFSLTNASSATDDILAVASRAIEAESTLKIGSKDRMAFAVLDNTNNVKHFVQILTSVVKQADPKLAIGVLTVLTFQELQDELKKEGFDTSQLDFVIVNAGAYIMCAPVSGGSWISDDAWESKAQTYWDKQLVHRTLSRMQMQKSKKKGESDLMRAITQNTNDTNGPLHLLFDFDPSDGTHLTKVDNATLINRVRKRIRFNGIRCNLTLHLVPREGRKACSILHATPMRANRPLAIRHLAQVHHIDMHNCTFICIPVSVQRTDEGHVLGAFTSDMESLIEGCQKVVVLQPGRAVKITSEEAPDAGRGEAAFERMKVSIVPYCPDRVSVMQEGQTLDDVLKL